MSKVRIGVAGANGAFGSKHLDALAQIDEVEIVAAMATTLDKANGVADKYSIPNRFDNYDQMLGLSDLDAVILATLPRFMLSRVLKQWLPVNTSLSRYRWQTHWPTQRHS